MSKIKNILTCMALTAAGAFMITPAMAQSASTSQTQQKHSLSPFERNQQIIAVFLKTDVKEVAFNMMKQIKSNMVEEIAISKRQIMIAHQSGDAKAEENAKKMSAALGNTFNKVLQDSRNLEQFDKAAVDAAFTKYLDLHQ